MQIIYKNICEWQKPVLTEQWAYELFRDCPLDNDCVYLAVPWSTLIDKLDFGTKEDKCFVEAEQRKLEEIKLENAFTVCQHDRFHLILPTLKKMGVNLLFASHMVDGGGLTTKDYSIPTQIQKPYIVDGVQVETIFLYPVNVGEAGADKDISYSFIGSYGDKHISNIREKIFNDSHGKDAVVIQRKGWQFELDVYQEQILNNPASTVQKYINNEKSEFYKQILSRSRFSLCPSGTGPASIRFLESLGSGAIPVILADTMMLPKAKGINWEDCTIKIKEKNYNKLREILQTITPEEEERLRVGGLKAYEKCSGENFVQNIRDYYEGS